MLALSSRRVFPGAQVASGLRSGPPSVDQTEGQRPSFPIGFPPVVHPQKTNLPHPSLGKKAELKGGG